MPAVRSQSVSIIDANNATLTLLTSDFGTITATVSKVGTTITITAFHDGIQTGQTVLTNPPAATVESSIDSAVSALILGGEFQFRSHLVSNNPIAVQIGTFNAGVVVPSTWWQ